MKFVLGLDSKKNNFDFRYTIIGGKHDEEVIYLVQEAGLQENIQLLGKYPSSKVYELVQEASLFILPSLEEGIANVAVEAMTLGTPVISTDCGGMQELITHNQEGWIVPRRDPLALARQIEVFTKLRTEKIETIRQAALQKVELEFNEEQMTKGMERLYQKVLSS